ncbi:NUDIX domain-containing protein [Yinghuangia soli]|uniref:NUDIX hydrolase n=1 Tax=Yinghuangia soli TaxID=2908204 RepID=A0AA41Q129_9ACTN|nr:NUDIX hydrolase [Yinghuangia soli]MCF2529600.1 NUDIX hydrolase [Yinghuangia soli]
MDETRTDALVPQHVKDMVAEETGVLHAAGAVILDAAGRLVVVNPSYKDDWELPGGMADDDEDPYAAARREVVEEIGLDLELGRLLVVDVTPARVYGRIITHFIFDAPVLTDEQVRDLKACDVELLGAAALPVEEALAALHSRVARRVEVALRMRGTGGCAYLLDGRPAAG